MHDIYLVLFFLVNNINESAQNIIPFFLYSQNIIIRLGNNSQKFHFGKHEQLKTETCNRTVRLPVIFYFKVHSNLILFINGTNKYLKQFISIIYYIKGEILGKCTRFLNYFVRLIAYLSTFNSCKYTGTLLLCKHITFKLLILI